MPHSTSLSATLEYSHSLLPSEDHSLAPSPGSQPSASRQHSRPHHTSPAQAPAWSPIISLLCAFISLFPLSPRLSLALSLPLSTKGTLLLTRGWGNLTGSFLLLLWSSCRNRKQNKKKIYNAKLLEASVCGNCAGNWWRYFCNAASTARGNWVWYIHSLEAEPLPTAFSYVVPSFSSLYLFFPLYF